MNKKRVISFLISSLSCQKFLQVKYIRNAYTDEEIYLTLKTKGTVTSVVVSCNHIHTRIYRHIRYVIPHLPFDMRLYPLLWSSYTESIEGYRIFRAQIWKNNQIQEKTSKPFFLVSLPQQMPVTNLSRCTLSETS